MPDKRAAKRGLPELDRLERTARNYDRLSRVYDLIAAGPERRAREIGLTLLGAREGEAVLEIGFGPGSALVSLARAVGTRGRVCGVDLSEGMLRVAYRRLEKAGLASRVDLERGDASRLPYPDASFDAVFMSFTLEVFDQPTMSTVLSECRRVLGPGGRLGVVALSRQAKTRTARLAVTVYGWAHRALPRTVDCRPIDVEKALADAGFRVAETRAVSLWGLPVAAVVARKDAAEAQASGDHA